MALSMDVRDLVKSGSKMQEDRRQPVAIAIVIEVDADDTLIGTLREALRPFTAGATVQVEVAIETTAVTLKPADAVIGVAGSGGAALAQALAAARSSRTPVAVVAVGDEASRTRLVDSLSQPLADLLVGGSAEEIVDVKLASWLADEVGSKRLALAHNFPFMRRAVATESVRATALQNALVGAAVFVPGADMPIMTANQAKMLLQIAAAYGEKLGPERLRELAAVVGGAFALRTAARQVAGLVPVLGWAVKGGIGYGGTMAMGMAAIEYFEDGADLTDVVHKLRQSAGTLAEKLPRRRHRMTALPTPEPQPSQPQLPGLADGTGAEAGAARE